MYTKARRKVVPLILVGETIDKPHTRYTLLKENAPGPYLYPLDTLKTVLEPVEVLISKSVPTSDDLH